MASVTTRIHDIEVENTAEALMRYPDGAMGHCYASTAHEPGLDFIEVFGDKGNHQRAKAGAALRKLLSGRRQYLPSVHPEAWKERKVIGPSS